MGKAQVKAVHLANKKALAIAEPRANAKANSKSNRKAEMTANESAKSESVAVVAIHEVSLTDVITQAMDAPGSRHLVWDDFTLQQGTVG